MIKKTTICLLAILASLSLTAAFDVKIDVSDSFSVGDVITFSYSFESAENTEIAYVADISCPELPIALIEEKDLQLPAGSLRTETYRGILVSESFEPQTCKAYVEITSPAQQVFSKNFTITTDPSFELTLSLPKTVFTLGERISIELSSELEPEVEAELTLPDGSTEAVSFPFSAEATQTGTYTLDVTASKEGYKTMSKSIQFAVIDKQPDIKEKSFNETWEEYQLPAGLEKKEELPFDLIIIAAAVILVLVVSLVAFVRAKRAGRAI